MPRGGNFKNLTPEQRREFGRRGAAAREANLAKDPERQKLWREHLNKIRPAGLVGRLARLPEETRREIGRKGGLATAARTQVDPEFKKKRSASLAAARSRISPEEESRMNSHAAKALAEKLGPAENRKKMRFAAAMKKFRAKGYIVEAGKSEEEE